MRFTADLSWENSLLIKAESSYVLSEGGRRKGKTALFLLEKERKKAEVQIFCKGLNEELCWGRVEEDIIWSPIDSTSPLQNNYFFNGAIRRDQFKRLF